MTPADASGNDVLVRRLHRIEGQVRGIERMLEEGRGCTDILNQIGAVATALEGLALRLLDDHVGDCIADALASGDPAVAEGRARDLVAAVQRFAQIR